ncbi:hypothetical protein NSERUTF1_0303 [Nocardia seriolae]|nr:hypothetical protein NSERUTF1_0303 [Nocardia seriolae]
MSPICSTARTESSALLRPNASIPEPSRRGEPASTMPRRALLPAVSFSLYGLRG